MTSYKTIYKALADAYTVQSGEPLRKVFNPNHPAITDFAFHTSQDGITTEARNELFSRGRLGMSDAEQRSWIEVYVSWFKVAYALERSRGGQGDWEAAYNAQKDLTQAVIRGFSNSGWPNWLLPLLYETGRLLRAIAIRTDGYLLAQDPSRTEKWEKLEDAARIINRAFQICYSDRAPIEESRKWGTYYMATLVFKTYFKLNAISLCKNVLNAINATSSDIPDFHLFPKSQRVSYLYYVGVYSFLQGEYPKAEEHLTSALTLCHPKAERNQEQILTYLIPCRLATSQVLPTAAFLARYSALEALFAPVCKAIRRGNLAAFNEALAAAEEDLVQKRIFLTVEKGREVCLRNTFRETWKCLDEDKRQKVYVDTFRVGMALMSGVGPDSIDLEEVECLLTNMIANGLMKGYIAHERGIVVLSNKDPFPGTRATTPAP